MFIHFYGFLLSWPFYVYVNVYDVLTLHTEWIRHFLAQCVLIALPVAVTCLRCGVAMCSMLTVCLGGCRTTFHVHSVGR